MSIQGHSLLAGTNEEPDAFRQGAKHSLSIRYEYIRLGDEAANCTNQLQGRVIESVYGGASIRYVIETLGNLRIQASVPHQRGGLRYAPGEAVQLGFDPEDALLLADSGAGAAS